MIIISVYLYGGYFYRVIGFFLCDVRGILLWTGVRAIFFFFFFFCNIDLQVINHEGERSCRVATLLPTWQVGNPVPCWLIDVADYSEVHSGVVSVIYYPAMSLNAARVSFSVWPAQLPIRRQGIQIGNRI